MSERETPVHPEPATDVMTQLRQAAAQALTGPQALGALAVLGLIVTAGLLAPGPAPGWWTWVRVGLVWLLGSIALAGISRATLDDRMPRISPVIIWGSLLLAVVVSLTLTPLGGALALVLLIAILLTVRPGERQPPTFWLLVAVLTPVWVWSAFAAWSGWLLVLIPLAVTGAIAAEHATRAARDHAPAHRLASWVLLSGAAALLLATALLAGIAPGAIAVAGLATVLLAGVDLTVAPPAHSRTLAIAATPLLALGWLVAL